MLAQQPETPGNKRRARACCELAIELLLTMSVKTDALANAIADKVGHKHSNMEGFWKDVMKDIEDLAV
jgi:hypothetical protein